MILGTGRPRRNSFKMNGSKREGSVYPSGRRRCSDSLPRSTPPFRPLTLPYNRSSLQLSCKTQRCKSASTGLHNGQPLSNAANLIMSGQTKSSDGQRLHKSRYAWHLEDFVTCQLMAEDLLSCFTRPTETRIPKYVAIP